MVKIKDDTAVTIGQGHMTRNKEIAQWCHFWGIIMLWSLIKMQFKPWYYKGINRFVKSIPLFN